MKYGDAPPVATGLEARTGLFRISSTCEMRVLKGQESRGGRLSILTSVRAGLNMLDGPAVAGAARAPVRPRPIGAHD
jgi:hypothetical protein